MVETLRELPGITDSLNRASWSPPKNTLGGDRVNDPWVVLQAASEHPGTWWIAPRKVRKIRWVIADPPGFVRHLTQVIVAKQIGGERAQTSSNRRACCGTG